MFWCLKLHQNVKTIALFSSKNYNLKLFITLKWPRYYCYFSLVAILEFPDFLQKSFITLTTWDNFSEARFQKKLLAINFSSLVRQTVWSQNISRKKNLIASNERGSARMWWRWSNNKELTRAGALVYWLWKETHILKVVDLNPGAVYWMDMPFFHIDLL